MIQFNKLYLIWSRSETLCLYPHYLFSLLHHYWPSYLLRCLNSRINLTAVLT